MLNEQKFMSRTHGVNEGRGRKDMVVLSFHPRSSVIGELFSPLGGWFLFLVVKSFNPLTSGSCACFWLDVYAPWRFCHCCFLTVS